MLTSQFVPSVLNEYSTPCSLRSASSSADTPRSPPPVVVNSVPFSNVPVIVLESLLMTTDSTLPSWTWSMNWV